jgi:hypothetical protein
MENHNFGVKLGTKSIVTEFSKSCARLENSVVEPEPDDEATFRTRKSVGQFGPGLSATHL